MVSTANLHPYTGGEVGANLESFVVDLPDFARSAAREALEGLRGGDALGEAYAASVRAAGQGLARLDRAAFKRLKVGRCRLTSG